jgi:hypothetical protein
LWVLVGRIAVADINPFLADDISAFIIIVMVLHKAKHWAVKLTLVITLSLIYTSIAYCLGFGYPNVLAAIFALITGLIAFIPFNYGRIIK